VSQPGSLADRIDDPRRLASTVALAVAIAGALFMVLVPLALAVVPPVELPAPFPDHNQTSETLLYFAGYFVLLPFSVVVAFICAGRISGATGPGAFAAAVALLACLLGAFVLLARLTDLPLVFGLLWLVTAAVSLHFAARPGGLPGLSRAEASAGRIWQGAAVLAVGCVLVLVDWPDVSRGAFAVCLLAGAAVLFAYGRFSLPSPGRRGLVLDLAAIVLILLAVPDLVIVRPEEALGDPVAAFDTDTIQFHQNLFLGAASQVLGGSALLVDTVSQYGIGSIYLIAAWFEFVPIGHGTLGFFDGLLSAFVFAGGYATLRLAGVGRLLAAGSLTVGVVALVYGLHYPIGGLLQHGAIRFGLPMLMIVPAVAAVRWPGTRRPMGWLVLAVVGLASVWALEAFLYVAFTFVCLVAIGAAWRPAGGRRGWLVRQVLSGALAIVVTQVLFALVTLAASGSLPDWGLYLTYLRDFLGGDIGDLTYDFAPWSPALAVAALYFASAAGIVVAVATNRPFTERRKPAFTALAAGTGYGIVLFSYFDNRSLEHILPYVALPALLCATIWLALLLDRRTGVSLAGRRWALGLALFASALVIANVWPAAGDRFGDSLLGRALPGGEPLRGSFDRLAGLPPVVPGSDAGERLLDEYVPGETATAVITEPDLDVDILTRSDRFNSLGITDAKEASWVPAPHRPGIEDAVAAMEAGDRLLVDERALDAFARLEREPDADPAAVADASGLVMIQTEALAGIRQRFRLKRVSPDGEPAGLTVVELVPR
jgi:hypothetical protein